MCRSEWHTPARVMRTRTSAPCGLGVSFTTRCSGLPCSMMSQLSILLPESIGRHGARACPLAQRCHLVAHHDRQRLCACELVLDRFVLQFLFVGENFVERSNDRLLDLGAREAVACGGEACEIESGGVVLVALEMDAQNLFARRRVGQVDEEDLVEAPLAQQ